MTDTAHSIPNETTNTFRRGDGGSLYLQSYADYIMTTHVVPPNDIPPYDIPWWKNVKLMITPACIILVVTLFTAVVILDLSLSTPVKMVNLVGLTVVFAVLLKGFIFRIPMNHLGLPESFFSGRFKNTSTEEDRQPIHKPYAEGFHVKPFWWRNCIVDQRVQTREIVRREYQTSNGTVLITGLIEFRNSYNALFRIPDVDQSSIGPGLDALIDDHLGKRSGSQTTEDCLRRDGELNSTLREKLISKSKPPRSIYGRQLLESEVKYGIEVLTVHISNVEPPDELREARLERVREEYEKESQATEREVLKEDLEMFTDSDVHPDLALKMAMRRQDKLPDNMSDERINIDGPDGLTSLAGAFLSKLGKNKGGSK